MEEMNGDSVGPEETRPLESESVPSYTESGQGEEAEQEQQQQQQAEVEPEAQGILISLKPGGQDVVPSTLEQKDQPDQQQQDPQDHQDYQDEQQQQVHQDEQHDHYQGHQPPFSPSGRQGAPFSPLRNQAPYSPSDPNMGQQQQQEPDEPYNIKVEDEDAYTISSAQMNRPAHHMHRPVDHFRLYEEPNDLFQGMPYGVENGEGSHSIPQGLHSGDGADYDMESNEEQHGRDPFDGIKSGFDLFRNKGVGYQSRGYSGDHSAQNRAREVKQEFKPYNEGKPQGFQRRPSQDDSQAPPGPRIQVMSRAKKAFIDERASLERPNRSLFVRNIDYNTSPDDVREMFQPYGDIQNVFSLIDGRGMMFITYYDIRAAEYAKKEAHLKLLHDRALDVHFSLPKEIKHKAECHESDHNGTLFVYIRGLTNEHIPDEELENFFSRYGDVKSVFPRPNAEHQKFIEFFDSRACARAFHEAQDAPFRHGTIDCKFAWDHYRPTPAHLRGTAAKSYSDRSDGDSTRGKSRFSRSPSPSLDKTTSRRQDSRDRNNGETTRGYDSYQPKKASRRSESRDRDSRNKHGRRDSKDYDSRLRNDNYKRSSDRDRGRSRDKGRDRSRDRSRDKDKPRNRSRDKSRDRSTTVRDRSRDRDRSKDRDRKYDRDRNDRDRKYDRDQDRGRERERDRDRPNNTNRYRSDSPIRTFHKPGSLVENRNKEEQPRPPFLSFQPAPPVPPMPFQPLFPTPPVPAPLLNAQKAQQLVNEMLISAGKAVPPPNAQPMFGAMPSSVDYRTPYNPMQPSHPLSLGQPPQIPAMPPMPPARPPMLPLPPMPPAMPAMPAMPVRPPQPPTDPRPNALSSVNSTSSELPKPPTSIPSTSTSPPVSAAPSQPVMSSAAAAITTSAPAPPAGQEPGKPTTEAQVQQLLQLLTQVQQQTQGAAPGANANGNQPLALGQAAASNGVMALLPHLSQLSQLVQQNFQPQQAQPSQPQQPSQVLSPQYQHAPQSLNYGNMGMPSGIMGMMMAPPVPPSMPVPPPGLPIMPPALGPSSYGGGGHQSRPSEDGNNWYNKRPSESQEQGKNYSDYNGGSNSNPNGTKRHYSEGRKDWDKDWDKNWNRKGHDDYKRRRDDDDDRNNYRSGGSSRHHNNNSINSGPSTSSRRESSVIPERHIKRENEDNNYRARSTVRDDDHSGNGGNGGNHDRHESENRDWDEGSNSGFRDYNQRGRGRGRGFRGRGGYIDRGRGRGGFVARGGGYTHYNDREHRQGNDHGNDDRDGGNNGGGGEGSGGYKDYSGSHRGTWVHRGRGRGRGRSGHGASFDDDRY
ncbi:hypothetical protein BGX29_009344 [Mortierella sp. GBA35]|nr:hypothetical protein BGX29_009344 [Mortierella sp. GBA35]